MTIGHRFSLPASPSCGKAGESFASLEGMRTGSVGAIWWLFNAVVCILAEN